MGKGKFKAKPTGVRSFSDINDLAKGKSSAKPRSFRQAEAEEVEEETRDEESEEEREDKIRKTKGTEGLIEIENPNLVQLKNLKVRDLDMEKPTELSRREREELEKQQKHVRFMKLQEQGKTDQAKKDLDRLSLIREQRAEAAKKREEEKAAKEQKKLDGRK